MSFAERVIGPKKRWRAYRARVKQLPEPYRAAASAVERYLLQSGATPTNGDRAATMFEDLADLFEQAAADGTPVRDVVGDEPLEFVEAFMSTYSADTWIAKERTRLAQSLKEASEQTDSEPGTDR